MKRQIITIDQDKCNGCGVCVPDCPEGALQVIDGTVRLVGDLFCDGLGACLGTCPEGALTVEEREAEPYDERRVMANIIPQGAGTIRAHLRHLKDHGEEEYLGTAMDVLREKGVPVPALEDPAAHGHDHGHQGCPGSRTLDLRQRPAAAASTAGPVPSALSHWPIQLKLLNPAAPYFRDADLLIAADCTAFAHGDFHRRFLANRSLVMFCPKLDPYGDEYVEKLAQLFSTNTIRSVTVARMEVPCCGGVTAILERALQKAGKTMTIRESVISVNGDIL